VLCMNVAMIKCWWFIHIYCIYHTQLSGCMGIL